MRTRTNRDSRPGRPRPAPERRPGSAPSTAWLEAQAAFSAPAATDTPAPAAGPVPVVVLRRSRPVEALAEPSATPAPGSEAADPGAARPARVFRVVSAPTPVPEGAAALQPRPLDAATRPQPPRPRRARRSQQAPGLATVISFAPPPGAVPPYREQMARLGELMRALDEALALAQQARSFELTLP
jgi:hypothetical protein